jgi:hypothetical protein
MVEAVVELGTHGVFSISTLHILPNSKYITREQQRAVGLRVFGKGYRGYDLKLIGD